LDKNWALPKKWSGYSQHSLDCLPLPTETLSGEQVLAFRDQAHIEYFNNPKYQQMVATKFGPEVLLHVNDMLAVKIKRECLDLK
jgi:hypothetical protein